jgi:8-oxo-dGTP pyrophosphatase MutT (NUDIX family)
MIDELKESDRKKETSAGGIVYKKQDGQIFVLMIFPNGWRNMVPQWTFPKGHIEGLEKPEDTAVREVREETGVTARIVSDLGEVNYNFIWEGRTIDKSINWYLMEYVSGDVKDHDQEVAEVSWLSLTEAEAKLVYATDKEIFKKARIIINDKL